MAERPVPEEARLGRLIFEAHEYLPGPDMARLQQLEEHLDRQATRRRRSGKKIGRSWWLALFLIGGAAAAAWWGGWIPERPAQQTAPAQRPGVKQPRAAPEKKSLTATGGGQGEDDSPVIYQRENF